MADDICKEFAKVQKKHMVEELTILVRRVHQAANAGASWCPFIRKIWWILTNPGNKFGGGRCKTYIRNQICRRWKTL